MHASNSWCLLGMAPRIPHRRAASLVKRSFHTSICLKFGVACLVALEGTTLKVLSFPRSEPRMQKTLPSVHKGCCKMVEGSFLARGVGMV